MAQLQVPAPPRRCAPFTEEPGFYADAGLWLYGNVRLLDARLSHLAPALGPPVQAVQVCDELEFEAERLVLEGRIIVTGIHNLVHQRVAVVPLRWGAPRILILSGGFRHHLGEDLKQEPFRAARLWRFQFDARTDLVVSRRAPDKLPTFALHNPAVDRLVEGIALRRLPGILFGN